MKVDPNQVQDIFDAALAQDTAARAAFVADACGDNTALRDEVLSLLAAHDAPGSFPPLPNLGNFMPNNNNETLLDGSKQLDPSNLPAGTVLGEYYEIKEIKKGNSPIGMGVVYRGWDRQRNQDVAIKVLWSQSLATDEVVSTMQSEIASLARLGECGLVRVYHAGRDTKTLSGGEFFLVMPYIEGITLQERLGQGRMSLPEVAGLVRQLGGVLAAVHGARLAHLALKPRTLILSGSGVKLIDCGLARVLPVGVTFAPNATTALPYLSPEQITHGPKINFLSDIYSFGVTAYEMLTGKAPFVPQRKTPEDRLESPRQLRPEIPVAAERLILQALAYDANARPQDAAVFGNDLADALLGKPEPSPKPEPPPPRFPPPWFIKAAAGVALALAVTIGVVLWLRSDNQKCGGCPVPVELNANSVVTGRPEGTGPATNTGIYTADPGFPTGAAPSGQAYATIGLTMWRTRPPNANDGAGVVREIVDTKEGAQPVKQQVAFESFADKVKPGEMINLSLEYLPEAGLPQEGYAYVVNRELYADGTLGPATLIFPTLLTYGGNNRIGAGRPIVLPGPDRPFRVDRNPSRADHVGETFTVIIAPQPLRLPEVLSQVRMKLPAGLVEQWERESGARAYRAELRGGAGRARTQREQGFGGRSVTDTAPLTKADPLPQTCLRLAITPGQPALVTYALRFKD